MSVIPLASWGPEAAQDNLLPWAKLHLPHRLKAADWPQPPTPHDGGVDGPNFSDWPSCPAMMEEGGGSWAKSAALGSCLVGVQDKVGEASLTSWDHPSYNNAA